MITNIAEYLSRGTRFCFGTTRLNTNLHAVDGDQFVFFTVFDSKWIVRQVNPLVAGDAVVPRTFLTLLLNGGGCLHSAVTQRRKTCVAGNS